MMTRLEWHLVGSPLSLINKKEKTSKLAPSDKLSRPAHVARPLFIAKNKVLVGPLFWTSQVFFFSFLRFEDMGILVSYRLYEVYTLC